MSPAYRLLLEEDMPVETKRMMIPTTASEDVTRAKRAVPRDSFFSWRTRQLTTLVCDVKLRFQTYERKPGKNFLRKQNIRMEGQKKIHKAVYLSGKAQFPLPTSSPEKKTPSQKGPGGKKLSPSLASKAASQPGKTKT